MADAIVRKIDSARLERDGRTDLEHGGDKVTVPDTSGVGLTDTVVFHTPVLALDERQRERERILAPGADGAAGAPYKMLRTQVFRRLAELNANTLAVMSASNGDGKTLTAINLAIAIAAQPGYTALLVDLDLRNPHIHRRLGIEPKIGVEECLEHGRAVYEAVVKLEGYERLSVLPARASVAHSSELLASKHTGEVVQELRTRYFNRVLIFDLPPVLLTDDALAFSQHVQSGLLVVAEGKTARDEVVRSLQLLHKLPIVGTVLNRSQQSTGAYY